MKAKKKLEAAPEPVELKRWSYSSWSTYDQCGARFNFRYLQKVPEPPSRAMARGTEIHTKAEYWTKGELTGPPPKELSKFDAQFKALRQAKPEVEAWWGVDDQWKPIKYGGWLVAKIDAFVQVKSELVVIDHKSGKAYPDKHEQQASLYGALGAVFFPKVKKIVAEMWYLDHGTTLSWEWTREQMESYQAIWGKRGREVMEHKNLTARPGWFCKWCPYSKTAKGPCKAA